MGRHYMRCRKMKKIYTRLEGLLTHAGYDSGNPNNVDALIGVERWDLSYFHDEKGRGYQFLADCHY